MILPAADTGSGMPAFDAAEIDRNVDDSFLMHCLQHKKAVAFFRIFNSWYIRCRECVPGLVSPKAPKNERGEEKKVLM